MLKKVLLPMFLLLTVSQVICQTQKNFGDINEVWSKFYQAFDSLDYKLMAEIHSEELVRVSGGEEILGYKDYIENYKRSFKKSKANQVSSNISLRFFERLNNDTMASERGIYKLVRNKDKSDEKSYYGQFHVIFIKENGIWKILMDYDSNPGDKIGEKDFKESHGITDYQRFMKK